MVYIKVNRWIIIDTDVSLSLSHSLLGDTQECLSSRKLLLATFWRWLIRLSLSLSRKFPHTSYISPPPLHQFHCLYIKSKRGNLIFYFCNVIKISEYCVIGCWKKNHYFIIRGKSCDEYPLDFIKRSRVMCLSSSRKKHSIYKKVTNNNNREIEWKRLVGLLIYNLIENSLSLSLRLIHK